MECEEQLELTQKALKHLVDEEKMRSSEKASSHDHDTLVKVDDDDHLLPLNLLAQQDDAVKHDDSVEQFEASKCSQKNETVKEVEKSGNEIIDNEEIMKELREIKKQNSKTHWLLSAMIVLTLTWQLSEVSLLWKFKQRLSNPFKAIGNMFKGKRGRAENNGTLSLASELLSPPSVSNESNE